MLLKNAFECSFKRLKKSLYSRRQTDINCLDGDWFYQFDYSIDIWICVIFNYSFLVRLLYGYFTRLVNQCSYFVLLKFLTKFHHRQPKNTVNVNILSCFVYTENKKNQVFGLI